MTKVKFKLNKKFNERMKRLFKSKKFQKSMEEVNKKVCEQILESIRSQYQEHLRKRAGWRNLVE